MTWISFFTTSYQRRTDRRTQWKLSAVLCCGTKHRLLWGKHFSPPDVFPLPQQHPVMFEWFDSLTFSLRLLALMTFAAKVRPEEFSTHLCTWPKRPLIDEGGRGKETGISPVSSHITSLKHAREQRTRRFMFQWQIKKWSSFSWDVLLCRVCLTWYFIKSELGRVSSLKTWINT